MDPSCRSLEPCKNEANCSSQLESSINLDVCLKTHKIKLLQLYANEKYSGSTLFKTAL